MSLSPLYISFFKSVLTEENVSRLPIYPFLFRSPLKSQSLQMSQHYYYHYIIIIIINLSGKLQLFIIPCYILSSRRQGLSV